MRRRLVPALLIALLALSAGAVSACGGSETPVLEGQPLEVGDLTYYVQLTRFLNPSNPEDAAYLEGQPAAPKSDDYLAVFLRVENESDQAQNLADHFSIVDTRGHVFEPIPSDSDFALQPGTEVRLTPSTRPSTHPPTAARSRARTCSLRSRCPPRRTDRSTCRSRLPTAASRRSSSISRRPGRRPV